VRTVYVAVLYVISCLGFLPIQALAQFPALPGSLVVNITSPGSNSIVAGTVTVTASVSPLGALVRGVQFQLDGVNLGGEDRSAPYSVSWDTRKVSNGSHTLTAIATDALGIRFVSSPVHPTVFNDVSSPEVRIMSPAPGATVGGIVEISADASDDVAVAGVQFLLDGANLGAEDTTSPYSVSWDTTVASDGPHTLTAVARDTSGNSRMSSPVEILVSNVPETSTSTRFEETDLSISYTAGWNHGTTSAATGRAWSGESAAVSTAAGSQATFNFTGAAVQWIGFRGPQAGIARVFLDGSLAAEVDTFSTTEEVQAVLYRVTGLAAGTHFLTIEVTGTMNAASTGSLIVVDAFDVSPSSALPITGTRLEEADSPVSYTSGWIHGDASRQWSGGTAAGATLAGAQATVTFTGNFISWIGLRGPQNGIARLYLDGVFAGEIDTFSATEFHAVLYQRSGLTPGNHTLTIEATGMMNAASTGALIVVDAFDFRTRFEETHPSISYTDGWLHGSTARAWSAVEATRSVTTGARAILTFTGTSVNWIGYRGPLNGIARVYIDSAFVADVDLYSPIEEVQAVVFRATGLTAGSHTLTIEVTGRSDPAANYPQVYIDAFDVNP
jgi:hypothetical protein